MTGIARFAARPPPKKAAATTLDASRTNPAAATQATLGGAAPEEFTPQRISFAEGTRPSTTELPPATDAFDGSFFGGGGSSFGDDSSSFSFGGSYDSFGAPPMQNPPPAQHAGASSGLSMFQAPKKTSTEDGTHGGGHFATQKVPPANEEADAPLFQNRASLPVNQGGLPTFQENPKQAQLAMQSLGLTSLSRPKSVPTITEQAALPTANEGTSQQLGGTATRTFATKFSGGALSKTSRSSPLFGKEKGGAAAKAATTLPKESTQGPSNMSLLGSMMRNKTSVVYTNPNERRPPEAGLMDPNTPVAMDRMEYNLRTPQAATQMWNHHEDASAATVGDGMGGGPFSPPVAIFNEGAGQKSANFVTPAPAPRETGATNASPSSLADEWMGATHMTEAEMLDETPRWQLVQEEFSQKMQRCGDITTSFDDQLLSATLLLETAHSDLLGWEARLLDQLDEMEEAEGAVDDMLHAFDS